MGILCDLWAAAFGFFVVEVADLSFSSAANEALGTARMQPSATTAAMHVFIIMVGSSDHFRKSGAQSV
jgi:hypothetical protein